VVEALLLLLCTVLLSSGFPFSPPELLLPLYFVIMAPSNDIVYRSHSTAEREGSIEKPTFEDGDKALEFLRSEAEEGETDLIDEKLLVRKIDFMIV
jgi:hypothetical protein